MHTEPSTGVATVPDTGAQATVQVRVTTGGALICELLPSIPFDQLRVLVRESFAASNDKHRGQTVRLDVGRRDFDLFELRRMINLIKDEFGVQVTGLNCSTEALGKFAERELKIRVHASQITFTPEPRNSRISGMAEMPFRPVPRSNCSSTVSAWSSRWWASAT